MLTPVREFLTVKKWTAISLNYLKMQLQLILQERWGHLLSSQSIFFSRIMSTLWINFFNSYLKTQIFQIFSICTIATDFNLNIYCVCYSHNILKFIHKRVFKFILTLQIYSFICLWIFFYDLKIPNILYMFILFSIAEFGCNNLKFASKISENGHI